MARPPLARDGWSRADALAASLIVAAGAGMVLESGPLGAGVAAAVAVAWLGVGVPYAFVLGQVGLVVGLDGGTTTPVAQTALVALLIADHAVGRTYAAASAAVAVAAATTAALLLVGRAVASTPVAGLLLIAAAGVAVYGIHRYEQVALGLAGEAE